MLTFVNEHQHVRTLIVDKVDRLTRNFEDYGALKRLGLSITSSRKERSSTRAQILAGASSPACTRKPRKAAGPLGHRSGRNIKDRHRARPEKAPLVRELFEAAATGA
jgi:DNA invertase Pin-like site-specific DNA recombinase